MKKMKYIAGLSAAAGFCLTAFVLSNDDAQQSTTLATTIATTEKQATEYTQTATPKIIPQINGADQNYDERNPQEEQEALEKLEAKTASAYGAEFGLDDAEASKRLKRQIPLSTAIQSIANKIDENSLAGWGVDHENGQIGWISVTDSAQITEEINDILAKNPDIEIRSAEHSYTSLQESQALISKALVNAQLDGIDSSVSSFSDLLVHTDIDLKNNRLVVGLDSNAEVFQSEASKEDMLNQIETHFANTSDIPVQLVLAPQARSTVLSAFVGGYTYLSCTSGFTTQHASGEFGFITAGHCHNITVNNGGGPLRFIVDHFFGPYDVQLHAARGRARVTPYFAYGRGANQFIEQRGTMARRDMMGMWVCNHGWQSGYSCGVVNGINFRPFGSAYPANLNFRFVSFVGSQLRGCGGDSGGPVFIGSTALGIISGGTTDTSVNDCQSVLTGPIANTFFASIRENLDVINSRLFTR